MFQRCAIQILHGDERFSVLFADVVNRADVGVIQCRCGLRLALESGQRLRVAGNLLRQELQRDKAVKARVLRFVDHAHTTAAEFLDDAVV